MRNRDKLKLISDARLLYITKGYTPFQISRVLKISAPTIHKYKKLQLWEKERQDFILDTEKREIQMLTIKQAEADFMNRQERAKKFKEIVNDNIAKIKSGELRIKSQETLLSATVDTSKHIELLEGNATDRVNFTEEEKQSEARKARLSVLGLN